MKVFMKIILASMVWLIAVSNSYGHEPLPLSCSPEGDECLVPVDCTPDGECQYEVEKISNDV